MAVEDVERKAGAGVASAALLLPGVVVAEPVGMAGVGADGRASAADSLSHVVRGSEGFASDGEAGIDASADAADSSSAGAAGGLILPETAAVVAGTGVASAGRAACAARRKRSA
jgi:hypothetical protein